jgi:hypothetical protein
LALTAKWYGNSVHNAFEAKVTSVVTASTLKCVLLKSTYTFSHTHDSYTDLVVATNEVAGAGYSTGGVILTNVTSTQAGGVYTLDCDDPTTAAATLTGIRYGVVYDNTPAAAGNKKLLVCLDLGEDKAVTGIPFVIVLNASGLGTWTAS